MAKGLFGGLFGRKKCDEPCQVQSVRQAGVSAASPCDCGGGCEGDSVKSTVIEVFGTGCRKCQDLHRNALEAASGMRFPIAVEYVVDVARIAQAGVVATPALAIGGKVVASGRVLSTSEIRDLILKDVVAGAR